MWLKMLNIKMKMILTQWESLQLCSTPQEYSLETGVETHNMFFLAFLTLLFRLLDLKNSYFGNFLFFKAEQNF